MNKVCYNLFQPFSAFRLTLFSFARHYTKCFSGLMQSVPITTKVVSSNPAYGEVYSIQHYVIKFVSDLRQIGGFLWFPPLIKLTATI
jgi:hypothetical protein